MNDNDRFENKEDFMFAGIIHILFRNGPSSKCEGCKMIVDFVASGKAPPGNYRSILIDSTHEEVDDDCILGSYSDEMGMFGCALQKTEGTPPSWPSFMIEGEANRRAKENYPDDERC